jgi:hypothetical protein
MEPTTNDNGNNALGAAAEAVSVKNTGFGGRTSAVMAESVMNALGTGDGRSVVEEKNPAKAALALDLMAEGKSLRSIGKKTGLGLHDLTALRSRHVGALAERKREIAQGALQGLEASRMLAMEKMQMIADDEEELKKTNLRDVMVAYGIFNDKFRDATGESNKMTHDVRVIGTTLEDAHKFIEAAKEKARKRKETAAVEVVVEEVKGNG